MKPRRTVRNATRSRSVLIGTTFLELIQELSRLTRNDHLVVAAVKDISRKYNVRAGRTLAPIRIVADEAGHRAQ